MRTGLKRLAKQKPLVQIKILKYSVLNFINIEKLSVYRYAIIRH